MFGYMTELDTVDICGVREIEAEGGTHALCGKTVQPLFSGVHYTQLFPSASNASVPICISCLIQLSGGFKIWQTQ